MSHLLHVFPLIGLHELTPITDAYQWNAHDHLEYIIYWVRHKKYTRLMSHKKVTIASILKI